MSGVSRKIDRFGVTFDDESLVADAGLVVATLMDRLGLESLVDETVRLGGRVGGASPGRKVLSLVAAMLVGATHIDHVNRLRAGATRRVLGFSVAAASTVGSLLRSFTWGHVRQLDKAAGVALARAWAAGGGPGEDPMTIDVDSTICEVSAKTKAGAAYGHTQQLGYHPLIATRAETGETLHTRLRKGSSQRGNVHFIAETVARARRAGAAGQLTVRADSGFWSNELIDRLDAAKVRWSVTIPLYGHVKAAIGAIDEDDWEPIPYRDGGDAQVAETTIIAGGRDNRRDVRLVVRRTRLTDSAQAALWPDWRHHALVTNRDDLNSAAGDAYHRQHATVELAIRDLKASTGLAHLPSGNFFANAAWLTCAALAHNLYRWITTLAETHPTGRLRVLRQSSCRVLGRVSDSMWGLWIEPEEGVLSIEHAGKKKRVLAPQEKYEIWMQLVRGESTVGDAAERARVDRSTVARLREVAVGHQAPPQQINTERRIGGHLCRFRHRMPVVGQVGGGRLRCRRESQPSLSWSWLLLEECWGIRCDRWPGCRHSGCGPPE